MIVLDGTHRVTIARELGFKRIPAILVNYSEVEICSWARIFHGRNVEKLAAKMLCKNVKEKKKPQRRQSIIIVINGEKRLTVETSKPTLRICRESHLFEKWMSSRGFFVEIVPDYDVENVSTMA